MISLPILKILLTVLVVGFVALAFAVTYLTRGGRTRCGEDSDDPPRYAERSRPAAAEQPRPAAGPQVQAGISGEVVAAIAAAVFCMEPGAVVTSVRRAKAPGVSAWKMAGLLENTRPF